MADMRQLLLRRQHLTKVLVFFIALALYLISRFHVVLIIWSFIGGIAVCCSFINSETLLPNFMRWHVRKKKTISKEDAKTPQQDDELSLLKKVCPVCGNDNCSRHRPELNIVALQPWTNLKIPEQVDEALDEFSNLVLKEFVYTWYRDLSQDEAFTDELKTSLRFIVSVLLRRIKKVDLPQLILDSVLKIAIRHLHFYVQVKKRAKSDTDLQAALIDFYGANLHCAARNRQAELGYLRSTSERIFPYILPLHALKCRGLCVLLREILGGAILLPAMDKIADPDIINHLLLVFLDVSQTPPRPPSPRQVPILANFAKPLAASQSCLHVELTEILSNPKALFPFMQFMKTEASVNVLQFYLSAEEFNTKILTPELTHSELVKLHSELKDLFRMYCAHNAADRIQFDDDIVTQLQEICDGSAEDVIKLQRTTPLFRAYEHAYTLLERTFLPLFHQSDDYYSMLCGQRLPTKLTRSVSRANKRVGDVLSFSKIGNKIKGVFKTTTDPDLRLAWSSMDDSLCIEKVEGDRLLDDVDCCVEEAVPIMRTSPISDLFPDTLTFTDDGPLHDLSAWRVTIISVSLRPEPDNTKKTYYAFIVEVRRVDVLENDFEASNWTVERRYSEFYVLEQKLSEFHGEFEDAALPQKKSFGTKSKDFLEARRPEFEQYLQKLLTLPKLRGSELLYNFLTPRSEFNSGFLTDINLGRFVRSGAMRLVKERGQHLETFLQSMQTSIETPKPKPCRFADADSDTISISSEQMANSLYDNNADIDFDLSPATPVVLCRGFEYPVDGTFDTILYIIEHVYTAPKWLLTMLMSVRIVFRNSIDTFLDWYLGTRLDRALQEHRLIKVIHSLRDALFFNTDPPRTDEQKEERRDTALRELKDYIPKVFVQVVGPNNHERAIELIFELLQYPTVNKQLSYMLFDKIVEELFPEVLNAMDDDPLKELLRAARGDD